MKNDYMKEDIYFMAKIFINYYESVSLENARTTRKVWIFLKDQWKVPHIEINSISNRLDKEKKKKANVENHFSCSDCSKAIKTYMDIITVQ